MAVEIAIIADDEHEYLGILKGRFLKSMCAAVYPGDTILADGQ